MVTNAGGSIFHIVFSLSLDAASPRLRRSNRHAPVGNAWPSGELASSVSRNDASGTDVTSRFRFSNASRNARSTDGQRGMYAKTSTPFGFAIRKSAVSRSANAEDAEYTTSEPSTTSILCGVAVSFGGNAPAPHNRFATRVAPGAHAMSARLSCMFRESRSTTASLLSVNTSSAHTRPARMPGTPIPAPSSSTREPLSRFWPWDERMKWHKIGIACHATCPVSSCSAVEVSSGKSSARSARTTTASPSSHEKEYSHSIDDDSVINRRIARGGYAR
mmetsp:Transcript_188/g.691  ORF Transcript_188/g.691 Transcript_188/m.691 type:complete len:275 (-) Transcript_188:51-875(-)